MGRAEGRERLRPYAVKAPPVELNAVTRTARRDRVTVIDLQRLRNIAFKSEPVGFQVTAVGTGGEQMHGDIMSAVACHRQLNASARWAIFMKEVIPPQFVRSGSGNVTPPQSM